MATFLETYVLPCEIVEMLCKWICCIREPPTGPAGGELCGIWPPDSGLITFRSERNNGPRANSTFAAFVRTCKDIRDIAYLRVVQDVFDIRAIRHVVQQRTLIDYYARVIHKPKPGHLTFAASRKLPHLCRLIIERSTPEYIKAESKNITGGMLNGDLIRVFCPLSEDFLRRAWIYHSRGSPNVVACRLIVEVRDNVFPEFRLSGAKHDLYGFCIRRDNVEDAELAFRILCENSNDLTEFASALQAMLCAVVVHAQTVIARPWESEDHYLIILLNKLITIQDFSREWLQRVVLNWRHISPRYIVYLSAKFGIPLTVNGEVDVQTAQYYITQEISNGNITCAVGSAPTNTIPNSHSSYDTLTTDISPPADNAFMNIQRMITYSPELTELIFTLIPVSSLSPKQLKIILHTLLDHPVQFKILFNMEIVESVVQNTQVRELAFITAAHDLDDNDRAIAHLYMCDSALLHIQKVEALLASFSRSGSEAIKERKRVFEDWWKSRMEESWLPINNILRCIKEREDAAREQKNIDSEQVTIRMNWSREKMDVMEWQDDEMDECSENSDENSEDNDECGDEGSESNNSE